MIASQHTALWALISSTQDCFPFGKSCGPRWQPPQPLFLPISSYLKSNPPALTRRERVGERKAVVSVSTLHYVIGHKYLTVGIICKYFIKLCVSSPLVPHGPLLVRFTNDNINMLKKKEIQFSFEKNCRGGGIWLGPMSNKTAEVSVMRFGKCVQCLGAGGLLDLPDRLSSKWTRSQKWSWAVIHHLLYVLSKCLSSSGPLIFSLSEHSFSASQLFIANSTLQQANRQDSLKSSNKNKMLTHAP